MKYSKELERDTKAQIVLGYANFDVALVKCLFAEIDRCHKFIDVLKSQSVISKSVFRRLGAQILEGDTNEK